MSLSRWWTAWKLQTDLRFARRLIAKFGGLGRLTRCGLDSPAHHALVDMALEVLNVSLWSSEASLELAYCAAVKRFVPLANPTMQHAQDICLNSLIVILDLKSVQGPTHDHAARVRAMLLFVERHSHPALCTHARDRVPSREEVAAAARLLNVRRGASPGEIRTASRNLTDQYDTQHFPDADAPLCRQALLIISNARRIMLQKSTVDEWGPKVDGWTCPICFDQKDADEIVAYHVGLPRADGDERSAKTHVHALCRACSENMHGRECPKCRSTDVTDTDLLALKFDKSVVLSSRMKMDCLFV